MLKTKDNTVCKPVVCVETGEMWDSIYYAAKELGFSASGISYSVNHNTAHKGLHFQFINPDSKKQIVYIQTLEEINQILEDSHAPTFHKDEIKDIGRARSKIMGNVNLYTIEQDKFYLWAGGEKRGALYCFDLIGRDNNKQQVDGRKVYLEMNKYYQIPNLVKDEVIRERLIFLPERNAFHCGIAPILGYNPDLTNQEHYSYEYDLNSAYAAALVKPIPDTTSYRRHDTVGANEIGFSINSELQLEVQPQGEFAEFVFKLMPSPFIPFVDYWYDKKANAANPEEKSLAKNYLTFGIGYMQKINPFIRATVIWRCNCIIENLLDHRAILWNTDAIYSLTPIPSLTLGNGLGEWKLTEGPIRYKNLEYQVVGEKPHYRGIPRNLFPDDFNLLTDELPTNKTIFVYEKETERIVRTHE